MYHILRISANSSRRLAPRSKEGQQQPHPAAVVVRGAVDAAARHLLHASLVLAAGLLARVPVELAGGAGGGESWMRQRTLVSMLAGIAGFLTALLAASGSPAANQTTTANGTPPAEAAMSLSCGSGDAAKAAFAGLFMQERQAARQADKLTFDVRANRIIIRQPSGTTIHSYLDNARRDFCKASTADRYDVLVSYVAASVAAAEGADSSADADNLMPAVRGRSYFAFMDLQSRLDGNEPANFNSVQSLGSDIVVQIARDSATAVAFLTSDGLAETRMSPSQALRAALTNLRKRSSVHWLEVGDGLYVSNWHDSYDASRLLLTDMIRQLSLKGDPVAMAPDPDTLIVTGSDDIANLQAMAKLARHHLEEATRPLSGFALVLRDCQWADFLPDDPPLRSLNELRRERLNLDYAQQQEMLQRLFGDEIFVATYQLWEHKGRNEIMSAATWTKNVRSLLPQTDHLSFVNLEDASVFVVPWPDAERIVGGRMKKTEWYPPRVEVESFPDAGELAELRKHELKLD